MRMRKILEDALVVGNATARTISFAPRPEEGFAYYPGSAWLNPLFAGGYDFLDPPPQITPKGVVPSPSDGARKLNARIAWFYPYTGITPGDVHAPDRQDGHSSDLALRSPLIRPKTGSGSDCNIPTCAASLAFLRHGAQ